jgi:hypothetical protein
VQKFFAWALALWYVLSPTLATAQDTQKKYFYTRQECDPAATVMQKLVQDYGESALFTGESVQFNYDGTPFKGGSMFLVNQDTGTWTLISLYVDGTACVTAVGNSFEPFTN